MAASAAAVGGGSATPSELRVRLCGTTAKVSLQPDEGLDTLRSRVAGAFGLSSAHFDILGPEGKTLLSDEDAARTATGAISSALSFAADSGRAAELTVDASEDALLDLERSHEETGALRWALLRKILGGVRVKLAEITAVITDGQRRNVALEESLINERSSREAGDAALRDMLKEVSESFAVEVRKVRHEAKTALEAAVTDLSRKADIAVAEQRAALKAATDELKEAHRAEAAARQREADEMLRRFEEIRCQRIKDLEERTATFKEAAQVSSSLAEKIAAESKERLALQERTESAAASLAKDLSEAAAKQPASFQALEKLIAEVKNSDGVGLQTETAARVKEIERIEARIVDVDSKLKSHQASASELALKHESIMSKIEPPLRVLISAEAEAREAADAKQKEIADKLAADLAREIAERKAVDERVSGSLSTLQESLDQQQRARETSAVEQAKSITSFELRLQATEQTSKNIDAACSAKTQKLETALLDLATIQCKAREAAFAEITATCTRKHDDFVTEIRRTHEETTKETHKWATTLIDRVHTDLRGEREALFVELKSHAEELVKAGAERVRTDVISEVKRVDDATADAIRVQQTVMDEERRRYEAQARATGAEVKAALDAHGEFAEALQKEQACILEGLKESLASEAEKRDGLTRRIHAAEFDMQKVRGHLPILFASPHSFK
eukprot:TRINITY_DN35971_c0_g1_i1.p1 TRINITY_DN35971_c0_g1~~TRINITY_DN35971_c0_g1_i1.p1  ORF type:complete len:683 (-),score=190.54 TRINITY_DN35971_c0_g1_i1:477-2525(-)